MSRILPKHIILAFIAILSSSGLHPYSLKLQKTLNNLLLGKVYRCYSSTTWKIATMVCAQNGQNLVQLLTKDEHNWLVDRVKSSIARFWVGGIQFQHHWYWKYPTWRIPIKKSRWFIDFREDQKVVAHEDHLDSQGTYSKQHFICEENYFSRNDIFTKVTSHESVEKLLSNGRGGEIECASKCLLTHDCQVIVVKRDGTCKLYSVGRANRNIDCRSAGNQCFYRDKPKY
ncbi:uncharacterized protein LOC115209117 [Octopus sinensis]|uniref:Uncharacterized protein LOC115209117 n=1 Tax=Octopus sinensis TaxID=2607531 RepID=A0A6P7S4H3_9MOLL|nr:uncharacterized protein LOC115209117 [Octopus sinensis]